MLPLFSASLLTTSPRVEVEVEQQPLHHHPPRPSFLTSMPCQAFLPSQISSADLHLHLHRNNAQLHHHHPHPLHPTHHSLTSMPYRPFLPSQISSAAAAPQHHHHHHPHRNPMRPPSLASPQTILQSRNHHLQAALHQRRGLFSTSMPSHPYPPFPPSSTPSPHHHPQHPPLTSAAAPSTSRSIPLRSSTSWQSRERREWPL